MNIISAIEDPKLFGQYFKDPSTWAAWRTFLKARYALPLDDEEFALYKQCTGRQTPPEQALKQVLAIVGRRGGKSWTVAIDGCYMALFRDYAPYLNPGEMGHIVILAKDRRQAQVIFRYVKMILTSNPMFNRHVVKVLAESIELDNRIIVEVLTADVGGVRGRTIVACILDELAFWNSEGTNPADEIIQALEPSMATIPNSTLLGISSPYGKFGPLYETHERYYGKDDPEVLVWKAPTRVMNPTISQKIIDSAMRRDAESAQTEWLAEFRSNVSTFLSPERIEACVVQDRFQLPVEHKFTYQAAIDAGFKSDAFVLTVGHMDRGRNLMVVDVIEGFEPESKDNPVELDVVLDRLVELKQEYALSSVTGDQFASEPIRQALRRRGVHFQETSWTTSYKKRIYGGLKTLIHEGRIELLDHKKLIKELKSLEQRCMPSGQVQIGHPRLTGYSDDYASALALLADRCINRQLGGASVFGECDLT